MPEAALRDAGLVLWALGALLVPSPLRGEAMRDDLPGACEPQGRADVPKIVMRHRAAPAKLRRSAIHLASRRGGRATNLPAEPPQVGALRATGRFTLRDDPRDTRQIATLRTLRLRHYAPGRSGPLLATIRSGFVGPLRGPARLFDLEGWGELPTRHRAAGGEGPRGCALRPRRAARRGADDPHRPPGRRSAPRLDGRDALDRVGADRLGDDRKPHSPGRLEPDPGR